MAAKDSFVKVILQRGSLKILGVHIIGSEASIVIQEVINLMYTQEESAKPLIDAMHIHPALREVVQRAAQAPVSLEQYHHLLEHGE
jgi:dihydrolipoamide dehydrogenase